MASEIQIKGDFFTLKAAKSQAEKAKQRSVRSLRRLHDLKKAMEDKLKSFIVHRGHSLNLSIILPPPYIGK